MVAVKNVINKKNWKQLRDGDFGKSIMEQCLKLQSDVCSNPNKFKQMFITEDGIFVSCPVIFDKLTARHHIILSNIVDQLNDMKYLIMRLEALKN